MRTQHNKNSISQLEAGVFMNSQMERKQNYYKLDPEEENKQQSVRMKFLVEHPEFDFLKNNPHQETILMHKNNQIQKLNTSKLSNKEKYDNTQAKQNLDRNNNQVLKSSSWMEISNDINKEQSKLGSNVFMNDNNNINRLNQSIEAHSKQNQVVQEKKESEFSNFSPIKLPTIQQNSINLNHRAQHSFNRQSYEHFKEKLQRQKDSQQQKFQMMAPQESYYEHYNDFYHQNDYFMNLNDDIIKKKLLYSSSNINDNHQLQEKLCQDNSFRNNAQSLKLSEIKDKSCNQNTLSQNQNSNVQTQVFKGDEQSKINQNELNLCYLGKPIESNKNEGDQAQTRYSQLNEMNKQSMQQKRGVLSEIQDQNNSYIKASNISKLQRFPNYSFLDHVNSQLQQIKLNQQSSKKTQDNDLNLPKSDIKRIRSITRDSNTTQIMTNNNNNSKIQNDFNNSQIKDYFNRKYNNKEYIQNNELSNNYPRYDYSEFKIMNPENNQRKRSSRSLIQNPSYQKRISTPKQNLELQLSAIETLQNIISEAAKKHPESINQSINNNKEKDINLNDSIEDIILDLNIDKELEAKKKKQISKKQEILEASFNNLNNACIQSRYPLNDTQSFLNRNDSGILRSTFNLQKELEKFA